VRKASGLLAHQPFKIEPARKALSAGTFGVTLPTTASTAETFYLRY